MRVVTDLCELERGRPAVMTIGAFDGVHRGHQFLIRQVVDRARNLDCDSLVLTFDPRPQVILRPGSLQLTDAAEKARIIAAHGPETTIMLPFTRELSQVPPGQFLVSVLEHVNLAEIWIGADFAFGHNREGNVDFLIRNGQGSGFAVHVVHRKGLQSTPISSTAIRGLVAAGDVAQAAVLLGHFLRVTGPVVRGFARGKGLGFPTANVAYAETQQIPGTGIYAAYLHDGERRLSAAVSVGFNPTFGGDRVVIEAHVLDFEGDLVAHSVGIDFVDRIREERKFDQVKDLVAQIGEDIVEVRQVLASAEEPGELLL